MRTAFAIIGIVFAACVSYIGTAHYIGGMISSNIVAYERWLLSIEDVSVKHLSYERGLFNGVLTYDIALRPSRANPMRELFEEFIDADMPPEIKLTGRMDVRHGPWVGKFTAARTQIVAALPEEFRPYLPKYPGQAPWLKVDATVDWTGGLNADFSFVDYNGRIGSVDDIEAIQAVVEGVTGRARVMTATPRGSLEMFIPRLRIANQTTTVQLDGVRLSGTLEQGAKEKVKGELSIQKTLIEDKNFLQTKISVGAITLNTDAVREWQFIWSGLSSMVVNDIRFENNELRGGLSSLTFRADTTRKEGLLSSSATMEVGVSKISDINIPAFAVKMAIRNIPGEPINDILKAVESMAIYDTEKLTQLLLARLGRFGERLIAAGPEFAFDRLALSVKAPDDINLSFGISVPSGTKFSYERMGDIADTLEGKFAFTASMSAIEELMTTALKIEIGSLEKAALKPEDQKTARERFLKVKDILSKQPMFRIDGDKLRMEAAAARGKLNINGNPVEPFEAGITLGQTLQEALAAASPPPLLVASPPTRAVAPPAAGFWQPNSAASPAFGQISLKTDFDPDPWRVQLTAGGNDFLDGKLGVDCKGYIDAAQPDFVLDYSAGKYDLFFYADSDADTGLIIRTPDGNWVCNDDGLNRGLDPTVQILRPKSGKYSVWVAVIETPNTSPATLLISEANPDPQRRR